MLVRFFDIPKDVTYFMSDVFSPNKLLAFEVTYDSFESVVTCVEVPVNSVMEVTQVRAILDCGKILGSNGNTYDIYDMHDINIILNEPLITSIANKLRPKTIVQVYYRDSFIYGYDSTSYE